ncbi:MAG: TRM11 family SAM-dependent methyltransferase [Dehalococcoidia bacterium]
MREITPEAYQRFLAQYGKVTVGQVRIRLLGPQRPRSLQPPGFKTEATTLWSFPKRGTWATHRASYRGNWAPQIARNLILRYSSPGDTVLDQMVGGGTTLVECKLTSRHGIGVDINRDALMLTMDRLNFSLPRSGLEEVPPVDIRLYHGDARNLDAIPDGSIDLIATHPPYASIIRYSQKSGDVPSRSLEESRGGEGRQGGRRGHVPPANADLSHVRSIAEFATQMRLVADEAYRVLKPDHYCAILVGDTRRSRHYVPIAFRVLQSFLDAGFVLKEDIIKAQWNTQTEGLWANLSRKKNFLLIMHEHLFVLRKPTAGERLRPYRESMAWW